jgi:arylsulfatase A-like enzyme
MLDKPLDVQPPRASLPERVKAAGLPVDGQACDVLWLDDGIGAVLMRLDRLGSLDNTVIFYFDDHGMERGKGSLYEGGIKSVAFVWGPAYVKGGRKSKTCVSNIDFAPTIMDLCKVPADERHPVDGTSFLPVLKGDDSEIHDHLFFELGATRAVLKDGWKYLAFRLPKSLPPDPPKPYTHLADRPGGRGTEGGAIKKYPHYFDPDQLYHVATDPLERSNLHGEAEQEERVRALHKLLRESVAKVPGSFAEFTAPRR